jgi:hypothetical protein
MTKVDFWFFFGAAFFSATVIGWVCFLEVTYRRERERHRSVSTGFRTAGAAHEIGPTPTAADRSRDKLLVSDPMETKVAHLPALKASQGSRTEQTQTARRFCA